MLNSSDNIPSCNVLQWNVQGITTSKEDILKLIDEHKPLVISVQETFLANECSVKLSNYSHMSKQGHYNHRFHGGVALYVHESCPYTALSIDSVLQVVAARIQIHSSLMITVASLYLPGRTLLCENELTHIIQQLPTPLMLTGDFNAHHTMWGDQAIDRRGGLIHNIVNHCDLNIVNTGLITHESGSAIDLTIVSPRLTADISWTTVSSQLSSDHYPILISFATPGPGVEDSENYSYRRADWRGFREDEVWDALPDDVHGTAQQTVDDLYTILGNLQAKYIPKYKAGRFFPKPWWSLKCTQVWKERERLYRRFKRSGDVADKVAWKRARAVATQTFREEKKASWTEFVSKVNINTPISEVWKTVNKIRGRPERKLHILEVNGQYFSSVGDIANKLAETLSIITSETGYSDAFMKRKHDEERREISFLSDNNEAYNALFNFEEMKIAINESKDNSPGPDGIHNRMFKSMTETALEYLLKAINQVWKESYFDNRWRQATVIPIPKPGKDHKNPVNYRPISLTSCFCKLIEKMINNRLMQYLENNKLFSHFQCGFRKYRSTVDHLVRLETFIRKAIAESKKVVSVLFDMEKAYDKTWRYGILRDMYEMGLRGRLPQFIDQFLQHRQFKVRLNNTLSSPFDQQTGVPQGSTLSVTLFAIKINSLSKVIPHEVFSSLYVDDVQIAYSHDNMDQLRDTLQATIDRISKWAVENGFTFSSSKTTAIQFYKERPPMQVLRLKLNDVLIPVSPTAKFLGLVWDSKLTWIPHISQLRDKCQKSLNLLRCICGSHWGADTKTAMNLYRALIRSRIDYGSVVYSSASKATLGPLDTIANDAMRIASGAFKTSPVKSLQILVNEPPLHLRRQELTIKYYLRVKSHLQNPSFNSVINTNLKLFFSSRPTAKPPFIIRAENAIREYELPVNPVMPYITPKYLTCELGEPRIDLSMCEYKKEETPAEVLRAMHRELLQRRYGGYEVLYTDGSKSSAGVGAACVMQNTVRSASLPMVASILTAEMTALKLALETVSNLPVGKFLICSDSLSSLLSIRGKPDPTTLAYKVRVKAHELNEKNFKIVLSWVPSHVGIPGNEKADRVAVAAASRPKEFIHVPYKDWFPLLREKSKEKWRINWASERGKLYEIRKEPGEWKKIYKLPRRAEVVVNRLRLGHTKLTHEYLVNNRLDPPPLCGRCYEQDLLTVEHILIDCPALRAVRQRYFGSDDGDKITIGKILGDNIPYKKVCEYLKSINMYDEI